MSKWLRRGLEQNPNNVQENSDNFQPPFPTEMATASPAAVQYTSQTPQASPAMVGFSTNSQNGAMDVDQHDSRRAKDQYHYHAPPMNGTSTPGTNGSKTYDARNRSVRSRHEPVGETSENSRSRSNRSSSRSSSRSRQNRASNGGTAPTHHQYQPRPQSGATGASAVSAPLQHYTQGQPQYKSPTPSRDSLQPSFPPAAVTADSPTQSQPSHRRPAYLLHRDLVIGKGSYGQVCIASRGEPEGHTSGRSGKRKKFACKCVMLRNDPKYIAKLQEEVNVLRELRGHQNVIRLYDVFCVDNELFIITELGRGGDLFHLLTTHPKHGVTEAYAAKTVAEMLSAVAFLHSRHICHRDLKLENWVLESGKDVWSPLKLIDFGLSTHFTPGQRLSRVVGSSYYVAPEVLKKSYTEACDLWSLGVIVYMLLSGAPPFYGKNDEAIKSSIVQGEYTFPHELFRDVSDEAMAFVSTLLSYNTEYRYTAQQALTHPWLASNLDPDALQKAKDGARGIGLAVDIGSGRPEPMQM